MEKARSMSQTTINEVRKSGLRGREELVSTPEQWSFAYNTGVEENMLYAMRTKGTRYL